MVYSSPPLEETEIRLELFFPTEGAAQAGVRLRAEVRALWVQEMVAQSGLAASTDFTGFKR
jgi:hypothetical protein